jgi:hypothetical protein
VALVRPRAVSIRPCNTHVLYELMLGFVLHDLHFTVVGPFQAFGRMDIDIFR